MSGNRPENSPRATQPLDRPVTKQDKQGAALGISDIAETVPDEFYAAARENSDVIATITTKARG
jgi:hypothetical protein